MGYGVAMTTRCYRHMSAEERETLSLGLAHGHSLRTMASVLGRAPRTVSRESARNTPPCVRKDIVPVGPTFGGEM